MGKWRITVMVILIMGMFWAFPVKSTFSQANSTVFYRLGSSGYGVTELQARLAKIGYFRGATTGFYWWKTYWSVRNFQYAFGLPVNGTADLQTITMLNKATPNWQGTTSASSSTSSNSVMNSDYGSFSANDINLMTHVVYGEARNQPIDGEVAVAAVILNRYHSNLFPHSIPAIIFQPGAFTSVSNGQAWLGTNSSCQAAVLDAIHGWDPSHGALYYWNPATAVSTWVWNQPILVTIGNHVFAK